METYNRSGRKFNSASAMLYFLLSFILSLIFFVLTVTLLSVGVSTIIIWIGIPILFLAFAMLRGIANIERSLLRHLLDTDIAEPYPLPAGKSWWKTAAAYLRDVSTWKSLLYVLIKFPFSMALFWLTFSLWVSALAFVLCPIIYLFVTQLLAVQGIHTDIGMLNIGLFAIHITGVFDIIMFFRSLFCVPVGLALLVVTHYIVRGLAWLMAEIGRVFLSPAHYGAAIPREEPRTQQYQYQ